ncbi:MAG: membrane protease YdiL (CAAX protease family) [Clostridium sp.]|jgi:membrane protease YdiL (CAAX protease family)
MYSNAISTGVLNFILFAVVLLIRKIVHKEGIKAFLIHVDKRGLRLLIEGIIVGFIGFIMYTLIVCLFCEGTYNFQTNILKKTLLLLLIYCIKFLAVALFEESLIRGYILQKLLKRFSMVKSIIISSAIFGGLHFFAYSSNYYFWIGIINASIIGVLLSVIVIKTNSLMMAVGFHLTWNLTQRILFLNNIFNYNVSVNFKIREGLLSGTYFVPEAGLAVSIVLLVISIYIYVRFRQVKKNVKYVE